MDAPDLTSGTNRVEQLLREAQLLRMRSQWAEAETLCRRALDLEPDDAMAQEMLADLLVGKGKLDEAIELYRKALEKQPQKAGLEDKIAHLVLEQAQEEQEKITAQLLMSSPSNAKERKRSATVAILLSLLLPGGGQLFVGQYVKGGILLAGGLGGIALGMTDLMKLLLVFAGARPHRGEIPPNQFLAFLGLLGMVLWFYSLLDASSRAGRISPKDL